ncbi:MAG TPA: hypothetical protein VGO45_06605 [Bacteroidia bacterium]|nr:hypothetical protein [Bacteroidia bacterium]
MKKKSALKITTLSALLLAGSQIMNAQWAGTSPGGAAAQYNRANVGINIPTGSTAAWPLHVVGKTRFDIGQTNGAGNGRMYLTRTSSTNQECLLSFGTGPFATGTSSYDWVQGTYASSTANTDFVLAGWTAGRVMTVLQANGNMGLGAATNPLTKVQSGGDLLVSTATSAPASAALIHSNTGYSAATNPDYTWYGDLTTGLFHPTAGKTIGFAINGTEAMRVASNGYVGVNITNPTQMFHMNNGAILLQGTVAGVGGPQILLGGTPGVQTYGQYGMEYETAAQASAPAGGLNFWKPFLSTGVNTNNILFLSDNGMVGVNTPNPTAQLTVNGTTLIGDPAAVTLPAGYKLYVQTGILTEKVKVALTTTTDWADYVFEKNYKLKSLDEVKSFVEKNKHLPGVPSASDLKEQGGIDLGKMDAKLLEKIEELTLYSIQLKEENKNLTERLTKLEAASNR